MQSSAALTHDTATLCLVGGGMKREKVGIGEHLKGLRDRSKLTVAEVAERTANEVGDGDLLCIEAGHVQPRSHALRALSQVYRVNYVGLLVRAGIIGRREMTAYLRVAQ